MVDIGIFLGRTQPFHEGHKYLIRRIFKENDEVIICIGSAQKLGPDDARQTYNPLSFETRKIRITDFIEEEGFDKPYRILPIEDIDSDKAWPSYLAAAIRLDKHNINRLYFGESIATEYRAGLEKAGFTVSIVKRQKFEHEAPDHHRYTLDSASDIRQLYREKGFLERL